MQKTKEKCRWSFGSRPIQCCDSGQRSNFVYTSLFKSMAFPTPRTSRYPVLVRRGLSGIGLFTQTNIPAHRFVIEYWGEIVDDNKADRVCGRYVFDLGHNRNILGNTRKNTARYINHACRPNCESRTIGTRIYIYSTRQIKTGDEITYDYGNEYFNAFITKEKCRCKTCVKRKERKT